MDVKLMQVIKVIQKEDWKIWKKVFRSMYGPIKVTGDWQIRYNYEVYQLYIQPEIIHEINLYPTAFPPGNGTVAYGRNA